jgi:Tfp pilus assembly protein PilZ
MVEYSSPTGLHCDPATTLGAGGLFIETESPLRENSPIKLRFQLSSSATPHEIEGRVVWRTDGRSDGSTTPGMGIEFTDRGASKQLARELEHLD